MTLRADLQLGMSEVNAAFAEGEAWTYAPLSSQPGVKPPTYGAAVAFPSARTVSRQVGQEWDENTRSYVRRERLIITTTGVSLVASQGDAISDGTVTWSIESVVLGYTLTHWTLVRDLPLIQSRPVQGGL